MGQKHRKLLLAGSLLLVNVLVFMIALAKTNEMVKMPRSMSHQNLTMFWFELRQAVTSG